MSLNETALLKVIARTRFFNKILNLNLHQCKPGGQVCSSPGFEYDDFNRAGYVSIYKLDRMSQTVLEETLPVNRPSTSEIESGSELKKRITFLVGRNWTVSRRFHDVAAVDFPMLMQYSVTKVGNTSYDKQLRFFENRVRATQPEQLSTVEQQPLASCVYRVVGVDEVSRRPVSLLPSQVEELTNSVVPDGEIFVAPPVPKNGVPDNCFTCLVPIRYEDLDFNLHTNTSSYLAFAQECAAQAARSGFYSRVGGDIAFYRAKSSKSLFLAETGAGDNLSVSTWEDEKNKLLLNFAMNRNGKMINFTQIEYFDNLD